MKKHVLRVVAIFSLLAMLPIADYASPMGNINADIPFDFVVGKAKLPAGKYTIKRTTHHGILLISSKDRRANAFTGTYGGRSSRKPSRAKLVFNRYGNQYFLSQVWEEGSMVAMQLSKSRAERELAKEHLAQRAAEPEIVTVLAQ
ncbi:MAG: hypothetical protein AB1631_20815 [Acidobacteriota bacterium]